MDFELSDEHKLFRDTIQDFAEKEVAPGALERDKTHEFPHHLIEKMAQHFWLAQRAVLLQETCFDRELPICEQQKLMALYLRYQTTHERAFERCVKELRTLRNETRKQKIGFESQECKRDENARKQTDETRKEAAENHAWMECVLAAADLVAWSKLICFADDPELARCEIANFRYRILHMAARVTRSGRAVYLRLDRTWAWAKQLALGFARLRSAFA